MQANGLAHPPFDAIAYNSLAERSRDCESDTWTVAGGFADTKSGEERPTMAGTLVVNSSEILRSQQADTFRKTRDGGLPLVADRKLFPPCRPAAGENGPAVLGFHARAEAVRFRAVAVIRLKGAFRHCSSSLSISHADSAVAGGPDAIIQYRNMLISHPRP